MPGSPIKLNPLKRRDKGGSPSLHATFADGYYSELKSKGFVVKKRKVDSGTPEPTDMVLEYDDGYAVCGLGEGAPTDVSFARPKRAMRAWKKAWPESNDSRGVMEFARKLTTREEQAPRRLSLIEEVAAWKALRRDVRIKRAITTTTTKRVTE